MATQHNVSDQFLDRVLHSENTAMRIFYDGLHEDDEAVEFDLTQFDNCAIAGINGGNGLLIFRDQIDQYQAEEDVATFDFFF
jgi:hypothetical protein